MKSVPQSSKDKINIHSAPSSDEESGEESDEESDEDATSATTKVKGKCKEAAIMGSANGKEKHANDCSDEEEDDATNESYPVDTGANPTGVAQDNLTLPSSPSSAAQSKKTRLAFLRSLSDDKHYHQLVRLLYAAKVSESGPYYLPPSVR